MQTIKLQPVPNQTASMLAAGQLAGINLYTMSDGNLYIDILLNNVEILTGVLCLDRTLIVRAAYFGFIGDFIFVDTQGNNDPQFSELGARYQFNYVSASDLATL